MRRCILFLLLSLLSNTIFGVTGEIFFESTKPLSTKLKVEITKLSYTWTYNENTHIIILDNRQFPIIYEGTEFIYFDSPNSQDSNHDYLPWGLYDIVVTCYDLNSSILLTRHFYMDFRDESWSLNNIRYPQHDTHFYIDPDNSEVYIQKNGTANSHITINNNDTKSIWQVWGNSSNSEWLSNFKVPINVRNRIENGIFGFGYLLDSDNNQVLSDNDGLFPYNSNSTITSGTTEYVDGSMHYGSFNWQFQNVNPIAGQSIYNVSNNFNFVYTKDNKVITRVFKPSYGLYLKNVLEGYSDSYGIVYFKDPMNSNTLEAVNASGLGYLKADAFENLNISINGLINQRYAAKATNTIVRNQKNYTWYSGDYNPYQESDVLLSGPLTLQAYYKSNFQSSINTAFANNGQRKILRTSGDGALHLVYESMNRVWYEKSTDNGTTWTIMNGGQPLYNGNSKLPSLSFKDNEVIIVYQADNLSRGSKIVLFYPNGGANAGNHIVAEEPNEAFSNNLNPVVAWGNGSSFLVLWERSTEYGNQSDIRHPGIYYVNGRMAYDQYLIYSKANLPDTYYSASWSHNPAIAVSMNYPSVNGDKYDIAWENHYAEGYVSQIQHCRIMEAPTTHTLSFYFTSDISSTDGYNLNTNPSIISAYSDSDPSQAARICWMAGSSGSKRTVFKDPANPGYYCFWGYNVNSPTVTLSDSRTSYAVAWSENGGSLNKFADQTQSSINTINTTGKDLQVSNGSTPSTMFALAHQSQQVSAPYAFQISPGLNNFGLNKSNKADNQKYSRQLVISKGRSQYFFILGEITIDGNTVKFPEISDKEKVNSKDQLITFLETDPFTVSSGSSVLFSNKYGVTSFPGKTYSFSTGEQISIKCELIDCQTGKVIANLNKALFDKDNKAVSDSSVYKINLQGIANKTVKVRVSFNDNINASYSIADIITSDFSLAKRADFREISVQNSSEIRDFSLEQNYPNPFNPRTKIAYSIPKQCRVSLKIFDLLGKQVAELVNQIQTEGNYSVDFDAAGIPSGIYVYKLSAGDEIISRKMIVLK